MEPITREEMFMAAAGGQDIDLPKPMTRGEMFLSKMAGSLGGGAPSDWNASEGEPGHVLNRPFYSEVAVGTVLAETSPVFSEDDGSFNITDPISLTTGNEYTVNWNGTEYTCVCGETMLDGGVFQYLGNTSVMGGDDTGEPFFMLILPDEIVAEVGVYAQIMPLDGSTELTVSITGMVETVIPIPAKYLPGAFIVYDGSDKYLYKTPDTSDPANLLIKEELASLVKSGTAIYRCYTAEDGSLGYFLSTEIAIGAEGGSIIYNTSYGRATCFVPNTRDV